jgi:hypothetical protein
VGQGSASLCPTTPSTRSNSYSPATEAHEQVNAPNNYNEPYHIVPTMPRIAAGPNDATSHTMVLIQGTGRLATGTLSHPFPPNYANYHPNNAAGSGRCDPMLANAQPHWVGSADVRSFPLTKYKERFTPYSQAYGASTTLRNYATYGGGLYEDQVMHGRHGPVPPTLNHDDRGFVSYGTSSRSCRV